MRANARISCETVDSVVGGRVVGGKTTVTVHLVVLLDLGSNTATVRGMTNSRHERTNLINERGLLVVIGIVHGSLNHVVCEGIAKHPLKLGRVDHLLHELTTKLIAGGTETLFDDVGTELLTSKSRHTADHALTQGLGESGFAKVKNVLDNVVAEWVLDEGKDVLGDGADELTLLLARGMIDTALEHTASMAVSANSDNVMTHSVDNELDILLLEVVQAFLNDMVAIEVLNELDDLVLKSLGDKLDLVWTVDELDHLLQSTSAVLVEGNLDHVLGSCLDESGTLLIVGVLEQLLTQVIAEWIYEALVRVRGAD